MGAVQPAGVGSRIAATARTPLLLLLMRVLCCAVPFPPSWACAAGMKRIDLICLIASPICVGLVLTYGGAQPMAAAILAIAGWNLLSWGPECLLLKHAQEHSAKLRCSCCARRPKGSGPWDWGSWRALPGRCPPVAAWTSQSMRAGPARREEKHLAPQTAASPEEAPPRRGRVLQALQSYLSQPVMPAALALALIYLTVMSFGTVRTAWLGSSRLQLAMPHPTHTYKRRAAQRACRGTYCFVWPQPVLLFYFSGAVDQLCLLVAVCS